MAKLYVCVEFSVLHSIWKNLFKSLKSCHKSTLLCYICRCIFRILSYIWNILYLISLWRVFWCTYFQSVTLVKCLLQTPQVKLPKMIIIGFNCVEILKALYTHGEGCFVPSCIFFYERILCCNIGLIEFNNFHDVDWLVVLMFCS